MDFLILGPLEVVEGLQPLRLGGTKQQTLLAVLILEANRVVSTDRLIDALWGEAPPDRAAHTLQAYVSELRKVVGGASGSLDETRISTRGPGYVLHASEDQVDLHRFERKIEEGRRALVEGTPGRASELLREALDLWRGPPLAGLPSERFAEPHLARIEELRLSAIEDRIEADLAVSRQPELVGELRALVGEFPLRERLRGQLMLALYRSGRQAEALAAYRDAKRMLAEELGIDPTPDLQRLERAILRQDTELDLARTPGPAPAEASGGPPEPDEHEPADRPRRPRVGPLVVAGAAALALVAAITIVATIRRPVAAVSRLAADMVARLDGETGKLVAAIPTTGTAPTAIAWQADSLWVANTVSRTVARIDPASNRVVSTIPTGGAPTDLAAGDGVLWVLNGLDGTLVAIDPRTNDVASTIDVAVGSGGLAVGDGTVWVTNTLDAAVTAVDEHTRKVVDRIPLGQPGTISPTAIAADGNVLWLADDADAVLMKVDTASGRIVGTSGLRAIADRIAVADDGAVWATSYAADLVSVVDPETLQATTLDVGPGPIGIAIGDGSVWVADSRNATLTRVDRTSGRIVDTIRVAAIPEDVALADDSVWVSLHA